MAFRLIRASNALAAFHLSPRVFIREWPSDLLQNSIGHLRHPSPLKNVYRHTSFFNRNTSSQLWASTTVVSNAGRRRGRAKGKARPRNLNRGQVIGVGKINMVWPGLNAPVTRGSRLEEPKRLPDDPEREARIIELRDSVVKKRKMKLSPLDRGWSGGKMGGRSIGAPDPIDDENFEGFDTKILEFRSASIMTGNMGRQKRISSFVITGNGNGLIGFASGKATDMKVSLRIAKNRAGARLIYINRYNGNTIYHDFICQFGKTRIYVYKKGEGYGLRCHRALKNLCELVGITDLRAKVEGSRNLQHIIKAFVIGLLQQKTPEQMAEEKKLHVVEFREENGNFPTVVASPTETRKAEEIPSDEVMDFTQYVLGGKVIYNKPKPLPFYTKLRSWQMRLRKTAYLRNKEDVRLRMLVEHGECRSFYADKYPEARANAHRETREAQPE